MGYNSFQGNPFLKQKLYRRLPTTDGTIKGIETTRKWC